MDAFNALGYQTGTITKITSDLFNSIPVSGQRPIGLVDVTGAITIGSPQTPNTLTIIVHQHTRAHHPISDGWEQEVPLVGCFDNIVSAQ